MEDRSDRAAVLVADGVEHQSLEGVHRDAHRPALPGEQVRLDGEAHSLALGDLERAKVGTEWLVVLGEVASPSFGQGHIPEVLELEDLPAGRVDRGEHAFDRAGVPVVGRCLAVVREAPHDPPTLLDRVPEVAGRPGVDLDLLEVGDPAAGECREPPRVRAQGLGRPHRVVEEQRRQHPFAVCPLEHLAGRHTDDRLDDRGLGPGYDDHPDPPVGKGTGPVGGERRPTRFLERHRREESTFAEVSVRPHRVDGGADLLGSDRLERVDRCRGFDRRTLPASDGWAAPEVVSSR